MTKVLITNDEVKILAYEIWGKTKIYHDTKMKIIKFMRRNRPKYFHPDRWENINYTARWGIIKDEQKRQLLREQQELFDKLKAEFGPK